MAVDTVETTANTTEPIQNIDRLEKQIKEIPSNTLQHNLYVAAANICTLMTSFYKKKGAPGWSKEMVDEDNIPMLSEEEQNRLETLFANAPWLYDILKSIGSEISSCPQTNQKGGALNSPQMINTGNIVQSTKPLEPLKGDDISMDSLFETFLKKTDELDKYWADFARGSKGYAKLIERDITLYGPGGATVDISTKPILILLVGILDAFRLSYAKEGEKSTLLSLIVLIEEFITGQWRQALFTLAGFLSPSGVAIGILFKYITNAWMLINPDLRNDIIRDFYKGTKSLFVGFLLWLVSILPPESVKAPIEATLTQIREKVGSIQEALQKLESAGTKALGPKGQKLNFSNLNLDILKDLSLDKIQNFQSLAQWDLMVCSEEFDDIISSIKQEPILRFFIELLGVPTTDEEKIRVCKRLGPYPPVSDVVKSMTEGAVTGAVGVVADAVAAPVAATLKSDSVEKLEGAASKLEANLASIAKGGSRRIKSKKAPKRQTFRKIRDDGLVNKIYF